MANDEELSNARYDWVSLLIGVNNQFQGLAFEQMETGFNDLLDQAITLAGNDKDNVFVLSIPDYGITSFGQAYGGSSITSTLNTYNTYIKNTCETRGITFIDITEISNIMSDNKYTSDGLHPSGFVYSLWADEVYSVLYAN